LKLLANLGTGFDCASVEEMRAVLNLGVDPARILFANPCKSPASLIFARNSGILCTTFDNIDELDTIKRYMPEAQLFLRIYANDDTALISLSEKFGAPLDTTALLLSRAWELGLEVIGVSFHVGKTRALRGLSSELIRFVLGTGAQNPNAFCKAIGDARVAFSEAEKLGFKPTFLDIGGGFQDDCFESAASLIRKTISVEFPAGVTTIAEPGRYFACQAYTLVSRVLSRRRQLGNAAASGIPDMLYQSDGIYGNFLNVIMEKEKMAPRLIGGKRSFREHRYSIWGPTCDSMDCVVKEARFGSEVKVGDWLRYDNMGG
jgi:ornithine decarboxylase